MDTILNPNPEVAVSLNVGSNKVCAVVGRKNIIDKVEILGHGVAACHGVSRGIVTNIDKTVSAINDAIDMAERKSKQEIRSVYVGIAGEHIKSLHHQGVMYRDKPKEEISVEDIEKLTNDMHKIALPHGDKILHVVSQEFYIDNKSEGHIDPIGMTGSRVESNFHIITANSDALENLVKAVNKAQLSIAGFVLEPLATAEAVLSKDEKKAGVVLVDIGGGTTEVTIFVDEIVRYTSVIPLGSNVITKDIKTGCSVLMEQAEKLKIKFGSALSDEIVDNRIITIPGLMGREPKEISEKNLARIIQSRVEEIFEYVMWEIRRSGFESKLMAGMVLTGGGAKLKDIELLAEFQTGLQTRIGNPLEDLLNHLDVDSSHPSYATGMGVLLEALKKITPGLHYVQTHTSKAHVFTSEEDDFPEIDEDTVTVGEGGQWLKKAVAGSFESMKKFFAPSADNYL